MLKTIAISVLFLSSITALPQENSAQKTDTSSTSSAQKEPRYFRLDFVIRELDGKRPITSRNYSTTVVANDRARGSCSLRTGNRVPIPTSAKEAQFNYSDVGVSIDCNGADTVGSELALGLSAEISSLLDSTAGTQSTPPLLRSVRWRSTALVPTAKPTVVFSSQDDKTNHTLELEVTATPLH